ncbi:MAG: 23S rRNA (guanosine(2251)-2'-O)-methyltransferase RlmB [Thermoanaerobaculia bacterium]
MILSRLHPVEEAVASRPGAIEWVMLDSGRRDRRARQLEALCRSARVQVRWADRTALDRLAGGGGHQGVLARLAVRGYRGEGEALEGPPGERFLLVLDGVQDPQNLGAILRVADGAGAGVVVPERGSAPLSEAVARSSAGAVERVAVFRAGNLRRFLDRLRDQGFRTIGLDPSGRDIYGLDLTGDLALVLGAEGRGMRRLVREGCDLLAKLPMRGELASLNVSAAAAAAAYEALRQRSLPKTP